MEEIENEDLDIDSKNHCTIVKKERESIVTHIIDHLVEKAVS